MTKVLQFLDDSLFDLEGLNGIISAVDRYEMPLRLKYKKRII
jgi:hypothetical protein